MAKIIHYWAGAGRKGRVVKGRQLPAEGRTQCGKWVTDEHGCNVLSGSRLNPRANCSKCKAKVKGWA